MDNEKKFALLIDADNVSSKYIEIVTKADFRECHHKADLRGLDFQFEELLEGLAP